MKNFASKYEISKKVYKDCKPTTEAKVNLFYFLRNKTFEDNLEALKLPLKEKIKISYSEFYVYLTKKSSLTYSQPLIYYSPGCYSTKEKICQYTRIMKCFLFYIV
jgi:hypothetical protein